MKNLLLISILIISTMLSGNATPADAASNKKEKVTGAGATFPLPFYNLAFKTYQQKNGTTVTYGGIGSGGGIRSLKDRIVDFGGTDAFLSEKELKEMPYETIHIPTCMGAVVMAYNLPEVKDLKLTGEIIADIYLGKIKKWNDRRIQAANPGVALPDKELTPVYRSDGSGTTFVFSDYLTKISNDWKEQVGTGKSLKWPAGIAAKGNPGVAGVIIQTAGSIGYVGSEYAFSLKIPMAQLQNKAGNYVSPTTESISAAASGDIPADTRTMITNSPAVDAYPISCFTWIILYKEQSYNDRKIEQAQATVDLLSWMLSDEAQALTTKVHYSPLPASAVKNAQALLKSVTFNGKTMK
ncbi:phosphate ABC transporter substrate-binding protein PstS [Sanguibacteroides justesenii]|uniref:Phosphate-binding protein n=2 Tax=Porphyromonadaceae TaxID=171551 RepID=A0A0C3ME81_9PORP|nr:phosphate ABC transporter substrate-binding protein [Sanguibacteroides justesenii]KIO44758.1 phosphate ABC transporter substrate-binding protein [Sanguibacteroides justesenii]PXZ43275.1 phosphate ABC transporter substrate-binding protein PstS [Sanguibacteroides justesenii]